MKRDRNTLDVKKEINALESAVRYFYPKSKFYFEVKTVKTSNAFSNLYQNPVQNLI